MNQHNLEIGATEAHALLDKFDFSKSLRIHLSSPSTLPSSPRPWSRYGQASRLLRILRQYYPDAEKLCGINHQTIERMLVLQELLPALSIDDRIKSKDTNVNISSLVRKKNILSEEELMLCRALLTTNQIFRCKFIEFKFKDDFRSNTFVANKLEEVRTQTHISKNDFFILAKLWFELLIGSRTQFAHPHESTQQWQADLDWMVDIRGMLKDPSHNILILTDSTSEELENIRSEYFRIKDNDETFS